MVPAISFFSVAGERLSAVANVHRIRRLVRRATGGRRRAVRAMGGEEAVISSAMIKAQAFGLGFDLAGITRLGPATTAAAFDAWLARGYAGDMAYLPRTAEKRKDSRRALEGMRSAIVVALSYGGDQPSGPVARYARGDDYHDVMLERLNELHRRI